MALTGRLGSAEQHDLIRVAGRLTSDIDGVVDVVNNLGITQPVTSSTPRHGDVLLKPEEFLAMLTKPEELVGMLSKPGEFVASAYDFAEQMLTSQRKFAEGMVEAPSRRSATRKARRLIRTTPIGPEWAGKEADCRETLAAAGPVRRVSPRLRAIARICTAPNSCSRLRSAPCLATV